MAQNAPQGSNVPNGVGMVQLGALGADTPEEEILRRPGPYGVLLDYITARTVQNRLDLVVGPGNWQCKFEDAGGGGVRCSIGILVDRGDGTRDWVWKGDVGTPSDIESEKGAHSGAFKRAAVMWGIARDLYHDGETEPGQMAAAQQQAPQQAQMAPQQPMQVQQPQTIQQAAQPQQMPVQQPQQQYVQPQQVMGQPVQVVGQQMPVQQQMGMQSPWACPLHNSVKLVPAGVSQRTGRAYRAFYACDVPGCDQKGPSL